LHDSEARTTTSSAAPHSPSLKRKTSWKTSKPKSHTAGSRHERRNTGKKRNGCKLCRVYQSTSAPMRAFTNDAPTASPESRRGSPSPRMCHTRNHHRRPLPAAFSHHPRTLPDNLAHLQQNLFLCCPTVHPPIAANPSPCNTLPHLRDRLHPTRLYPITSSSIAAVHRPHCLPRLCLTTSSCIAPIRRLLHPPRLRPTTSHHFVQPPLPCRLRVTALWRIAVFVPSPSVLLPVSHLHRRCLSALPSARHLPLTTPCTCRRPRCLIRLRSRHLRPQPLVPCLPCLLTS
jgi:hypothetical protein